MIRCGYRVYQDLPRVGKAVGPKSRHRCLILGVPSQQMGVIKTSLAVKIRPPINGLTLPPFQHELT